MVDIRTLREIAGKIPLAQPSYLHRNILARMVLHRQNILSSNDPELITDYLNRSTDAECLAVLSEIANSAPLSDDYQELICHLARKVFLAAGLETPTTARLATGYHRELTPRMKVLLEDLRKGIRRAQRGTVRWPLQ